jgi:hypothetical protein
MINDLVEFFSGFFYSRLLVVVMGAQVFASVLVKSIMSFYDF